MAKADALRDYYKDLEVSPQADTDEIKKQYRKLALKYHPDRNRGHEDEASLKFQNIQAANEVLTDPQERAKYDAGRRRAAGLSNNRASNLRKNPYESTPYYPKGNATAFPPPPRRTQPQSQPQRPAFTSSASAFTSASGGARRYEDFAAGFSKSSTRDGPKSTHHSMPRTASPDPIYSTSPPKARNARAAHPTGPPPGLSRSQTTRAPKPGTFNPNSNSREDEPPAKTASTYYHILRGDKAAPPRNARSSSSGSLSSDSSSPAPPRTSFNPPLPPREQQRRAAESESSHAPPPPLGRRTKTSYSSVGGDKLDPFAEAFNRSASMNEGNGNRNGPATGGLNNVHSPTDRHRSASPPRNRYPADFVNSGSRHDRASGEPPRRTNSAEDRSMRASQKGPQNKTRDRQNFPFVEDDPSDEDHFYSSTGASETVERMMEEDLHRRQTKKREGAHRYKINRLSGEYASRDKGSPRIPSSGEMPPPPPTARMEGMNLGGKSKSRENSGRVDSSSIPDGRGQHPDGSHSQFQPNAWNGERFFGSEERRDSAASDRRGRPPARHEASFSKSPKNMSSAFPPTNGAPTESPRNSQFSEGDWAAGFSGADFVNHSVDGRASPTRGGNQQSSSSASRSRGNKTRKPSKRSGMSKHQSVVDIADADDIDEETLIGSQHHNGLGRSSGHSSGRDSGAMDIDSPQPQPERTGSFDGRGSGSRRSRMDSYDRNRPEFRKEGSYQVNGASSTSKRPVPAPPHAPSPPQNSGPFNMDPMRNVEPLGRTSSGLQDMKDVGASLPFESRPSSRPPNLSDSDQQQFPQPPTPPPVPTNTKDWEVYVQQMKVYLSHWDQFNRNVLSHFEKNQTKRNQMGSDWVGFLNESEKAGYFRYQKLVDDDIAWRVWWTKKCDEHQRTMRNFGHVRDVVRKTTSESSRGR